MDPARRKRVIIVVHMMYMQLENVDMYRKLSDDDEAILMAAIAQDRRAKVPRISGYAERVVPKYSFDDFKEHFRLTRGTFDVLVGDLRCCPQLETAGYGRSPVTVTKQAMVFLWYISNPECFRSMSDRFGIS